MAKRKDSKALFEVIARGKDNRGEPGMAVPQWLQKQPPEVPAPPQAEEESSQPPVEQAPPQPGMLPVPQADETPAAAAEPTISSGDGRVRVSLNYASVAAAILVAIVALGGMFWLGRVTGHGHEMIVPDKPLTENVPVRLGVTDGNAAPAAKAKYYLVIERMLPGLTPENKADAEAIVKYLETKGKTARISEARMSEANKGQLYVVLSTEPGFADPKSPEAIQFAQDIEDLGKAYHPPPGRKKYLFIQHNKDGLNPSYIPLH